MEVCAYWDEDEQETGSRYCPLDRCERSIFFCLTFCSYLIPPTGQDNRMTCSLAAQAPRRASRPDAQPAAA
jgi:hypothetical protein